MDEDIKKLVDRIIEVNNSVVTGRLLLSELKRNREELIKKEKRRFLFVNIVAVLIVFLAISLYLFI